MRCTVLTDLHIFPVLRVVNLSGLQFKKKDKPIFLNPENWFKGTGIAITDWKFGEKAKVAAGGRGGHHEGAAAPPQGAQQWGDQYQLLISRMMHLWTQKKSFTLRMAVKFSEPRAVCTTSMYSMIK